MAGNYQMECSVAYRAMMEGDPTGSVQAARRVYDERGLGAVLADLMLAAASEVNREDPQRPTGMLTVVALRRLLTSYPGENPWPAVAWAAEYVTALEKVAPGPTQFRTIPYRVDLNDSLELTVELMRVVRKGNFYKVYSILISVEDPGVLVEALYGLASAVPGNRGYMVILARMVDEASAVLSPELFRLFLLPVVELMNTIVQSTRYTAVLLSLTRLGHLTEYVETPPAEVRDEVADWIQLRTPGEFYWHMANKPWTAPGVMEVLWQRALHTPGQQAHHLYLTRTVQEVARLGQFGAYFNQPNLMKATVRELFAKQTGAPFGFAPALQERATELVGQPWHLQVPGWLDAAIRSRDAAPLIRTMSSLLSAMGDWNHRHDVAQLTRLLLEFEASNVPGEVALG